MLVAFCSGGNDSVALVQYLHETTTEEVVVAYSDTRWASPEWDDRLRALDRLVTSYGFTFVVVGSIGFASLVLKRKGFPRSGMQFCTTELKILPAKRFLNAVDPDKQATCVVGVRREESARRLTWPEWVEESDKHDGRQLWSPLVRHTEQARNQLVSRAGFDVLPHRSMECCPCVNASRADLRLVSEERIVEIERLEARLGGRKFMFRPEHFMGAAGIREVVRWAHSARGKYQPSPACDSGFCES